MVNPQNTPLVLVTGSTSGIGLAVASRLVQDGAGVVMHGQRSAEELSEEALELLASSSRVSYMQADLTNPEEASALPHRAAERLGGLTGAVLNAAVAFHKGWLEVSAEEWDLVMGINVRAQLLLAQSASVYLARTRGSLVVVSSTNALRVNKGNLVYDSGKAALNHMARAWALELRDAGVRVNVVMPGGVETPMLQKWLDDYTGSSEAAATALESSRESGLLAQPSDIAGSILFLLTEDARWVTGATLVVDGGAVLER
jgi:NAD(P)-dependent dehydrogenase (short-subunit alcohol dehydrogenase family)